MLEGLACIPHLVVEQLCSDTDRQQVLMFNLRAGIVARSHYSGMITMETGTDMFLQELERKFCLPPAAVRCQVRNIRCAFGK